ncbi:kinesin-domain-containing protein [Meira miltonrushii]|uniref:Kinesin-domain-containing protein n=1 Tax=Meira miltonrushii TaxID=1280837 RepID=A0A316VHY5_9BASI|nr:kinesin-domain-containing protein [Meira miltonrushii]PWN37267.1 kinesin-domain-containing protein [Meira miltonrushii]
MPIGGERTPTKANVFSGSATVGSKKATKQAPLTVSDNEPLKAYLRIRPPAGDDADSKDSNVEPYIEVVNDTEVFMNPPKDSSAPRARIHVGAVPTKYTFSKVFAGNAPDRSQASFFQSTTLPLVNELLQGQSGLIFTYGVTNSGKSYTVQGGDKEGEAGILPRSVDVVFNSIKGVESTSDIRPVGLSGVERIDKNDFASGKNGVNPFSLPGMSKHLTSDQSSTSAQFDRDTETKVKIDRNYRYSVWVSYVEVYNEKIFDLLDAAPPASSSSMPRSSSFFGGLTRSDSMRGSNWTLAANAGGSDANGPIYLQRKPLSLKNDIEAGGKFVSGLQEIRIHSPAEARELMRRGQENRRVFATMANRASSRSHGVFTIKVIREHAGEDDLTLACSTSRLSIVDLAGSERLSNTSASGDRLKEAGSINKSLMCLGQCIETLRKNQARAASFIPAPITPISSANTSSNSLTNHAASVIPRVLKRRPSIVPFRHSKLTELFQSFFTGEGRAVMIVNVNPFDTGFDENSHVMRFSAAAKEVHTVRTQGQASNLTRFVHPSLRNLFNGQNTPSKQSSAADRTIDSKASGPLSPTMNQATPRANAKIQPAPRAMPAPPKIPSHADRSVQVVGEETREVTIIEESDDEGDQTDPFVDHLMQKYEEMRQALFESEMRCAAIERDVREEMAEEMASQLAEMQAIFNERILADAAHNEEFVNRKLDLLARASSYSHHANGDVSSQMSESFASMEDEDEDLEEEEEDLEVECALSNSNGLLVDRSTSNTSTAVEDEEGSIIVLPPKSRSKHQIVSEDEEEEVESEVDDAEESVVEVSEQSIGENSQNPHPQTVSDYSSISMDVPPRMLRTSARQVVQDDEDDEDVTQDSTQDQSISIQSAETAEDDSEEEEEEEVESSDDSFNLGEESVESSFEAAPKARNSRARRATTATAARTNKRATGPAPTNRRRTTTTASAAKTPGRKSEHNSDASLVLTKDAKSAKKSPKKKLLGRRTLVDEETMYQHLGDSSLVDELQRRES